MGSTGQDSGKQAAEGRIDNCFLVTRHSARSPAGQHGRLRHGMAVDVASTHPSIHPSLHHPSIRSDQATARLSRLDDCVRACVLDASRCRARALTRRTDGVRLRHSVSQAG